MNRLKSPCIIDVKRVPGNKVFLVVLSDDRLFLNGSQGGVLFVFLLFIFYNFNFFVKGNRFV